MQIEDKILLNADDKSRVWQNEYVESVAEERMEIGRLDIREMINMHGYVRSVHVRIKNSRAFVESVL